MNSLIVSLNAVLPFVPVSYTHLDVYKRQDLNTLSQYYKADKTAGKGDIGFIVKYSGTVPAGTKVSEYKASISGTDK